MALLPSLGGHVDRILVVGCQPERLEDGIGLSETVEAAAGHRGRDGAGRRAA